MPWLTTHWEHPACVRCAGCGEPIELTWSSSVNPAATYHGGCYLDMKASNETQPTQHSRSMEGARQMTDNINHPSHYTAYPVEVIELTEHLNFCRGNVVKYVARAGLKDAGTEVEDLRKAQWYLEREITRLEQLGVR